MNNNKATTFISLLLQFEPLPKEAISVIESKLQRLELPKRHILLKQGSVCNYLFFIEKGMARNYYERDKTDLTIDIVLEGELLVAFDSFVSRQPSNENIEFLEDSIITALHYDDLQELYHQFPIMERIGRCIAEHNYNSLAAKNYRQKFYSTTQRYEHLFNTKIELIRRSPIGVIASYLGMSIETLSRIRSRME